MLIHWPTTCGAVNSTSSSRFVGSSRSRTNGERPGHPSSNPSSVLGAREMRCCRKGPLRTNLAPVRTATADVGSACLSSRDCGTSGKRAQRSRLVNAEASPQILCSRARSARCVGGTSSRSNSCTSSVVVSICPARKCVSLGISMPPLAQAFPHFRIIGHHRRTRAFGLPSFPPQAPQSSADLVRIVIRSAAMRAEEHETCKRFGQTHHASGVSTVSACSSRVKPVRVIRSFGGCRSSI